jgi:transposase
MLRMDEVNKIRKAYFVYGFSINKIAKKFNHSWETIQKIVSMEQEELANRGKRPNRAGSVITPEVERAVEEYLKEEKEKCVRKKQRYTAKKIYEQLRARGIYKGSRRSMDNLVKRLREKHNQTKITSYLPLDFPLGSVLQVDHGEAELCINEERVTGYLFVASVPGQSLRYCQIFPIKSQEAWGEFHERAYRFFGGCFERNVYDNDSVLVKKVLGTQRLQTNFSYFLEEHFGFESHFCNVASGNEKGSVENSVGYTRRNYLPSIQIFSSWANANSYLEDCCKKDIAEGIHYKTNKPVSPIFENLKQNLAPLPPQKTWSKSVDCRVDNCQLIRVDNHEYSVPEKFVGSYVRVALGVMKLEIFKEEEKIAVHERKYGSTDSLQLDHYLDQLQYKANAFWACKATKSHKFDTAYLELYNRLLERLPKKEANRELVKVLLLNRSYPQKEVMKALDTALQYGALDLISIEQILKQPKIQPSIFHAQGLNKGIKEEHICSFSFDLSPYVELCGGEI